MIAAKTSLRNSEILIEAIEESIQVAGEVSGRQTEVAGIKDNLKEAYGTVKNIITTMAGDFAESLKDKVIAGQKVEVEFNLGLSVTSGFWIMSGKGECAIKVKMIWEADQK